MNVTCTVCGSTEYINSGGFFYCQECNTKSQEFREEVYDTEERPLGEKLHSTKISKTTSADANDYCKWTTWEGYNLILIGLVNELIELGAPKEIKFTTLQLWAAYLRELEVAFTSTTEVQVPRLPLFYKKTDAEAIYQRKSDLKRKRSTSKSRSSRSLRSSEDAASSVNNQSIRDKIAIGRERAKSKRALIRADYEEEKASDTESTQFTQYSSSESAISSTSNQSAPITYSTQSKKMLLKRMSEKHFKEHCENPDLHCHKIKPKSVEYTYYLYNLNSYKLYLILYMALRLNNSDIQLSDMLRFIREGHLSYLHYEHFFPEEMAMNGKYQKNFHSNAHSEIWPALFERRVYEMAAFIQVVHWPTPDMGGLCARYIKDLQLPGDLMQIILQILESTEEMKMLNHRRIPNYEGRAMALLLYTLKLLFGIDDSSEEQLSKLSNQLEKIIPTTQFFNWNIWMEFIEWRKLLISEYDYPTRHSIQSNNFEGSSHIFAYHWNKQISKYDYLEETRHNSHIFTFQNYFKKLNIYSETKRPIVEFPPSLTPYSTYLSTIRNTVDILTPEKFDINYSTASIQFALNPKKLIKGNNLKGKIIKTRQFQNVVRIKPKEDQKKKLDLTLCKITSNSKYSTSQPIEAKDSNDILHTDMDAVSNVQMYGDKLVFLNPTSYYWINYGTLLKNKEYSTQEFKIIEKELPKSFLWLLKTCSQLIQMEARTLYAELLIVEGYLLGKRSDFDSAAKDHENLVNLVKLGEKFW